MNIAKLLHRSQVSQHYNRLWYRVNVFLFIILFASLSSNLSVVLATNSPNSDPVETQRRQLGLKDRLSDWSSWGHDILNSRFNLLERTIRLDNLNKLQLAWAFVFPGTTIASSQPAVVGNTLYVGSWNGVFYALNARTGELKWSYNTTEFTGSLPSNVTNSVRNGPAVAEGRVHFGDTLGNLYTLNAATGALIWAKRIDSHPSARITSSPIVWQGRLYQGVSSFDSVYAIDPTYPCCSFRGSMVALDAANGTELWRYYTISQSAELTGVNEIGTPQFGPSGASIWSTPALNPLTGLLYFGTSQNYSNPATDRSDALIALDALTGQQRWAIQLTPNDRWNLSCNPELVGLPSDATANCPTPRVDNYDFDFGASPNLFLAYHNGQLRTLVGAGQKSGIYHALDAATGEIIWQTQLSIGGTSGIGGIQWGSSWDGKRLYVATNRANPGSLNALDPGTGQVLWSTNNPANGCNTPNTIGDPSCYLAMPSATSSIPGLVFQGSLDGKLRAFNSRTGAIVWEYDTRRSFVGTNGLVGQGGSIDSGGATIVNGMLYINSGYYQSASTGMAGNVLLAFGLPER